MTVAVDTTDFYGERTETSPILSKSWFRRLGFYALIGFILLLANFPKFLTRVIDANIANPDAQAAFHAPIKLVQFLLAVLIGPRPLDFFEKAMACSFVLLWVFLALLVAFSVRRRGIRMFAYGVGGIVLGYLALHVIAWAVVAVVVTVKSAIFFVSWMGYVIGAIVAFVFHYTWPIFALVAIGGALYLAYRFSVHIARGIQWLLLTIYKYATHLLGTAVVVGLLWLLVPAIYHWVILPIFNLLVWLLTPVVQVIAFVVSWFVIVVLTVLFVTFVIALVLTSLALLGSLLVTQLQAGWHAARSLRHIMVAGFAIGSALGLIVLVSVATPIVAANLNQAWINSLVFFNLASGQASTHIVTAAFQFFLPQSVEDFVFSQLTNMQAPALDSFVFLAVMSLASSSLLFRIFSTNPIEDEYVPIRLVAGEYALMVGGLFVALFVISLAALSGDSHAS